MKVLIATSKTQGQRENDFSFTLEGEFVTPFATECSKEKVDGECGCKRSFSGLQSYRATTTARVADMDTTPDYKEYAKQAFGNEHLAADIARGTAKAIEKFSVGNILERRGSKLKRRKLRLKG